jgi:fibronectin-binding autotransporter adhesin
MKNLHCPLLSPKGLLAALVIAFLAAPGGLSAGTYYWDTNGATPGAGNPANGTWSGGGTTWSTNSTGSTANATYTTLNTDDLWFSAGTDAISAYTVTVSGSQVANSLNFQSAGAVTISGGTLITLGNGTAGQGGITFGNASAGAVTISTPITLNNSQTWNTNFVGSQLTVQTGNLTLGNGRTLTIDGAGSTTITSIIGGSTSGITKTGTGTLLLGGGTAAAPTSTASTFTGVITISGGVLQQYANNAFNGGSASSIGQATSDASNIVLDGGTWAINSSGTPNTDRLFTVTANGGKIATSLTSTNFNSTGSIVASGTGNRTLSLAGGMIFVPVIVDPSSGKTSLTLGAGTGITLKGISTYTGATTLLAGSSVTLDFGNATSSSNIAGNGSSALELQGATLTINGKASTTNSQTFASTLFSGGGNTITLTSGSNGTMNAVLGAITRSGNAVVNFNTPTSGNITAVGTSQVNGIIGPWATINNTDYATLNGSNQIVGLGATSTTSDSGWSTNGSTGTINPNLNNGTTTTSLTQSSNLNTLRYTGGAATLDLGSNVLTTNGILNGGSGLLTISSAGTGSVAIGNMGELDFAGNQAITITAPIIGSGVINKFGTNTLTLSGNDAVFKAPITINAGSLTAGATNAFGNNAITINSGGIYTYIASGYMREISGSGTFTTPAAGAAFSMVVLQDATFSGSHSGGNQNPSIYGPGTWTLTGTVTSGNQWFRDGGKVMSGGLTFGGAAVVSNNNSANAIAIQNSGTLTLDNTATNNTDRWTSPNGPSMSGGTFKYLGNSAVNSTETINGTLALTANTASTVQVTAGIGKTAVVTFSTASPFTRAQGSAVNFVFNTGASVVFSTGSLTAVNNILNGAFVNGTDFATINNSGSNPNTVSALASGSYTAMATSGTDINNSLLSASGTTTLTGALTTNTLKIDASTNTPTLATGGNNLILGTATTLAAEILKTGTNDATISGTGVLTHSTATNADFITRVDAGKLTLSAPVNMAGTATFAKSGAGLLILSPGSAWTNVNSADQIIVQEGAIRLDTSSSSLNGGQFVLGGGVFELTNGSTWTPTIGTGAGNLNWVSTADGGFAASGADRTVGTSITWNATSSVQTGHAILLNSATADSKLTLSGTINLASATGVIALREFRVADNTGSSNDKAEISGQIIGATTLNAASANGTQAHLLKTGAGTLILSNSNNTYNGETIVQNGTLQVDGTLAAVTAGTGLVTVGQYAVGGVTTNGTLAGNGTINRPLLYTSGANSTFSGVIGGANSTVTVNTSTGSLTLNGTNTYNGTTTITAGTLQIGNGGATGSLSTSSAISNNGTLAFSRNNTITQGTDFASVISGTGNVLQSGTGTLLLNGTNTYTGNTTINGGTLQFASNSAGNSTTSIAVNNAGTTLAVNYGSGGSDYTQAQVVTLLAKTTFGATTTAFAFDTTNGNGTYSNALTMAAGVTKLGANTLTLSGNNTYTGNTTVSAGTLQIGNGGATGSLSTSSAITNNGTLAFSRNNTITQGTDFASVISGTGNVTQSGTGTLLLNGTNTYTGNTTISAGTLKYGANDVISTGAVTIGGGTLDMVSYKDSVGAFTISSGTLKMAANQTSAAQLTSTGAVSLAGSLDLTGMSTSAGLYKLVAGTSMNGTFATTTGLDGNYTLKYGTVTANELDAQHKATIGTISATPAAASIITGGNTTFTFTVANSAPTNSANLTFSASSGNNTTGSVAGPITVTANSTSGSTSGLTFNGNTVGAGQTGSFSVTDGNATNGPQSGTVTVNVYDHASLSSISGTTLALGNVHVGYGSPVTSTSVSATNASGYRVDLTGSTASSGNLSLNALAATAAGNSSSIAATLATGQGVGAISQNFTYTFSDSSSLSGASSNLSNTTLAVSGNVYSGTGVWNQTGAGTYSYGTLSNMSNWTTAGGAPGLDSGFASSDSATFGSALASGSATVNLNGVSPSLTGITFDNASGSYTIAQGSGGNLVLNNGGGNATIATVNGSHAISADVALSSNLIASVSSNASLAISGSISGSGKNLDKTGSGTLNLSGANTYTGPTNVTAGTLLANNTSGSATGSGTVTVASGATLGGNNGTISGATAVQSGGFLAPGTGAMTSNATSSPALVTFSGGLTLDSGSTFIFALTSDTASGRGTDFSGVNVTGGTLTIGSTVNFNAIFNLAGSTVDFNSTFWDTNHSWLVFQNTNAPSASAPFFSTITASPDHNGTSFSTTFGTLSFSQHGGNNIYLDFAVSAVPEPSTWISMAALAVAGGVITIRRRRKT